MPSPVALRIISNPEFDRSANTAAATPTPKQVPRPVALEVINNPEFDRSANTAAATPTPKQVHNLSAADLVVGPPVLGEPVVTVTEAADESAFAGTVIASGSTDDNQTLGDDMAGPTREEYDAKLKTVAAETDTKLVRLEGKMDLILSKLDVVREDNRQLRNDVREDHRHTRNNQIATFIGLALLIIGIVAVAPAIFDLGSKFRETITKEIQEQMSHSAPRQQQ